MIEAYKSVFGIEPKSAKVKVKLSQQEMMNELEKFRSNQIVGHSRHENESRKKAASSISRDEESNSEN